jgi:hypothetical protein
MEHRFLGHSGFKVQVLGFGAGTFGGHGPLFSAWGNTDVAGARRIVDICLDAGVNLFDSADVYSSGASESILGAALKGRREQAIVSTKLSLRSGDGPNDVGSSRHHLIAATEAALKLPLLERAIRRAQPGFDSRMPVTRHRHACSNLRDAFTAAPQAHGGSLSRSAIQSLNARVLLAEPAPEGVTM